MANSTGTYNKMAKWFKWSSLFILLIPIAQAVLVIVSSILVAQKEITDYSDVVNNLMYAYVILAIIVLVLSVIWIILNIILFLTANTVKSKASPTGIRAGLFIAFVLVLAPLIIEIVFSFVEIPEWANNDTARLVILAVMPVVVALGYVIGYASAKKAVRETL